MSDDGPAFGRNAARSPQAAGVLVVVKDKDAETASPSTEASDRSAQGDTMPSVAAELLDDNLAAFLLAGGVDVKGLMTLLNEFLDFSSPMPGFGSAQPTKHVVDPMEILESWYRRDGIEDFIERLRHDSRRVGKAADAAAVRESPKALGEGQDK